MLRSVLVVLTLAICVQMFLIVEAKKKAKNQESGDCSTWTYGPCVLRGSNTGNASAVACGRGNKQGTRTGETCAVKEKSFPCRVPCAKKKCKYNKGTWSECNTETNQMTKTKTLTKGDPTCTQTKTITKTCRRAPKNNRRQRQNNRNNRE
jgi:hypothetical protein